MAHNVHPIDRARERWKRLSGIPCFCDAARRAHAVIARELDDLRVSTVKPAVLCLETLDSGIPSAPAGWDFIYSTRLLSDLPAIAACAVVKAAVSKLAPGGRLLIANVLADASLQPCRRCRISPKIQRLEEDMAELSEHLPAELISGQTVFRDSQESNVYLELYRTPASRSASLCRVRPLVSVVRPAV